MSTPFCDYVGVSVPEAEWGELRAEISAQLDCIGMAVEVDDARKVLWRSADAWGTVKAQKFGGVWAVGCSGSVCAGLRVAGRFAAYLAAIGSRPHRVTRLDATLDIAEDAAPVVDRIAAAGRRGEVSLTRKRILPRHVETHLGVRADGALSGTVYLGAKSADVRLSVYDKQHERMSKRGLPDCGPLTRYELRLGSGVGVTLRDCAEPASVFWHYIAPPILSVPAGVPAWAPNGLGFEVERAAPPLPAQRLLKRLDNSADVRALIALAHECGPYGVSLLLGRIGALARGAGVSPALTAVEGCPQLDTLAAAAVLPPVESPHAPTLT